MKRSTRILVVIVLLLGFIAISNGIIAQNVILKNKVFIQSAKDSVNTGYEYQDSQGNKYPVYLSSNKKAYIWVYSKKKQKWYRRYLPKITAMLRDIDNGKYSR